MFLKTRKIILVNSNSTFNIFGWLVCIIFYNHLNEIHALYNKLLKYNSFTSFCENIAYRELQGSLNQSSE